MVKKRAIDLHSAMMCRLGRHERVAVIRHLLSAMIDCQASDESVKPSKTDQRRGTIEDIRNITIAAGARFGGSKDRADTMIIVNNSVMRTELGMTVLICLHEILRKGLIAPDLSEPKYTGITYKLPEASSSEEESDETASFLEVEDLHRISVMCTSGLSEECPTMRRLHAQILAILFTTHSNIADGLTNFVATNVDSANVHRRIGIAVLIGATLRFACQNSNPTLEDVQSPSEDWARMLPLLPHLLAMGKEIDQPVRTSVLHAVYISVKALGIMVGQNSNRVLKLAMAQRLSALTRYDSLARYQIALIVESLIPVQITTHHSN